MSLLSFFTSKKNQSSASVAKERLQIIVAHERRQRTSPDYLPNLERDILEVVRKYVDIEEEMVNVSLDQRGDNLSVLELNVTFPDQDK